MPQVGMYDYVPDFKFPVLDLSTQLREAGETRLNLARIKADLAHREVEKHKKKK